MCGEIERERERQASLCEIDAHLFRFVPMPPPRLAHSRGHVNPHYLLLLSGSSNLTRGTNDAVTAYDPILVI